MFQTVSFQQPTMPADQCYHNDGLTSWYQFLLTCNYYYGDRSVHVSHHVFRCQKATCEVGSGLHLYVGSGPLGFEVSIFFYLVLHFTGPSVPIFCVAFLFSFLQKEISLLFSLPHPFLFSFLSASVSLFYTCEYATNCTYPSMFMCGQSRKLHVFIFLHLTVLKETPSSQDLPVLHPNAGVMGICSPSSFLCWCWDLTHVLLHACESSAVTY